MNIRDIDELKQRMLHVCLARGVVSDTMNEWCAAAAAGLSEVNIRDTDELKQRMLHVCLARGVVSDAMNEWCSCQRTTFKHVIGLHNT